MSVLHGNKSKAKKSHMLRLKGKRISYAGYGGYGYEGRGTKGDERERVTEVTLLEVKNSLTRVFGICNSACIYNRRGAYTKEQG